MDDEWERQLPQFVAFLGDDMIDSRGFNLNPNPVGNLVGGYNTGQQIRQQYDKTQADNQFRLLTGQILDPNLPPEQRVAAQRQRATLNPERDAAVMQKSIQNASAQDKQRIQSVAIAAAELQATPTIEGKIAYMRDRKARLQAQGIPTEGTDEVLAALEAGDLQSVEAMNQEAIKAGQMLGILKSPADQLGGQVRVQSAVALPGGGFRAIMTDGTTKLVKPGSEEAKFIQAAEERGAELQGLRSSERTAGSESQKQATKRFEQLANVRTAIANIDAAVQAIDDGAETGFIVSKLPSIRAASKRLDNIQKNMGLDVLRTTTFGALSEKELEFALKSALPDNLDPPELRKWLIAKKEAQEKLVVYLEDAAQFLGTPGNKVADWIKSQKDIRELQTIDDLVNKYAK